MDEMEREALRRAERMRSAMKSPPRVVHTAPEKEEPKPQKEKIKEEKTPEKTNKGGEENILDFLMKDKETTLILLLIIFLYDDNADPVLLMALVYLLV